MQRDESYTYQSHQFFVCFNSNTHLLEIGFRPFSNSHNVYVPFLISDACSSLTACLHCGQSGRHFATAIEIDIDLLAFEPNHFDELRCYRYHYHWYRELFLCCHQRYPYQHCGQTMYFPHR